MDETPRWMREQLHGDYAQAMRVDDVLYDSQTDHQRLRVIQNETFGRVLTLDDVVQVTEKDNFIYHEMLTHVPIFAHGAATRICIVGGGDGGMAREALRHKTVKHITMVEIDAGVVEFSKRYLPTISDGAFDDPRLDLVIADGSDFMKTTKGGYDVIIVDSTDPIGPGEALYSNNFYANARKALKDGGIIVTQNGVPFMQGDELTRTMRAFQALFADATCYLATVPSYAGGPMAFGWGTDSGARHTDVNTLQTRFCASGIRPQYYTAEVHKAAFALPGYIRKLFP
ncbi:spermidine synthase [Sagittula sp. P11]|uniref:polyamine aminopropyltransferase n=1 Tax=Sagittula sp. P11 TaxID=2009329 RepID=UPI000C2D2869|nr:polyamine aminopropyltransferase [Sagittula sp. P11]AUC55255.1 spermidine synthase [Sagittula sp. P11]